MTAGSDTDVTDPTGGSALTDLVVITGFSGAGKSTAMAAFEDEGYFCVDNLPPEMIRSLVDLFMHEGSKVARAAVVSDARGGSYFEGLAAMLEDLRTSGLRHRVLFLEADEAALLTRYKETRRRHPLAPAGSVAEGIRRERELLVPVRERADVVIDTGQLTAAMLRRKLTDELLPSRTPGRLAITFQSFGFKYGPSRDADVLFDVRFLPNPHYEPELRPLTGADARVVAYINRDRRARRVLRAPAPDARLPAAPVPGRGQGPPGRRHRLHRGPPPVGGDRAASRRALRRPARLRRRRAASRRRRARVIEHIGFEVSDLARTARFYDAVFFALGARRLVESEHLVAYGVNAPLFFFVRAGVRPRPATATSRSRPRARRPSTRPTRRGWPMGAPTTDRPGSGRSTGGVITPDICLTRTGSGWRSCPDGRGRMADPSGGRTACAEGDLSPV